MVSDWSLSTYDMATWPVPTSSHCKFSLKLYTFTLLLMSVESGEADMAVIGTRATYAATGNLSSGSRQISWAMGYNCVSGCGIKSKLVQLAKL